MPVVLGQPPFFCLLTSKSISRYDDGVPLEFNNKNNDLSADFGRNDLRTRVSPTFTNNRSCFINYWKYFFVDFVYYRPNLLKRQDLEAKALRQGDTITALTNFPRSGPILEPLAYFVSIKNLSSYF